MKTPEEQNNENKNNSTNDDAHWKWGIIYFNKDDKRIFPPRRISGFGWTINFANPLSILAFVAIFAVVLLITKFRKH